MQAGLAAQFDKVAKGPAKNNESISLLRLNQASAFQCIRRFVTNEKQNKMTTYNVAERRIVKILQRNSWLVEVRRFIGKGNRVERIRSIALRKVQYMSTPFGIEGWEGN